MKNKAIDVHNILIEQLERLNDLDDEEMKSEQLTNEIRRSEAVSKVVGQIVSHGRLQLDAIRIRTESPEVIDMPDMFKGGSKIEETLVPALPASTQTKKRLIRERSL